MAPKPKPDSIDADQFRQMIESPAFARFRTRLEAVLERERTSCERDEGTDLHRAQGAVAAIRTALGLPKVILAELRNGKPG